MSIIDEAVRRTAQPYNRIAPPPETMLNRPRSRRRQRPGGHGTEVLGDTGVALTAITARGFTDHLSGFQHHDTGTFHGQRAGRRQAGKAAADYHYIHLTLNRAALCGGKGWRAVEPVGFAAHGVFLDA